MNNPLEIQTSKWKRSPGDWKGIVEACAASITTITVASHVIDDGPVVGIPQPEQLLIEFLKRIRSNDL